MFNPKLAICNLFADPERLKAFAMSHGFSGIDWSFDLESIPRTSEQKSGWLSSLSKLSPLEVRFHCPFYKMDLGADDPGDAKEAEAVFKKIIGLVSMANGTFLTIHIGLGHNSTEPLSWKRTIDNLRRLGTHAKKSGVTLCLENLAWGWTSKPHLFEKLIRSSGVGVTFDLGHAQVSEAIRSQYYDTEDFITPHADQVFNAHVYNEEIPGKGHMAPTSLEDMELRLELLRKAGCSWWVLEVHDADGVLQTKRVVDAFLDKVRADRATVV
jgi:sugar phosphate isomerase/epimerase